MKKAVFLFLIFALSGCASVVGLGDSVQGFLEEGKYPISTKEAVETSRSEVERIFGGGTLQNPKLKKLELKSTLEYLLFVRAATITFGKK